VSENWLPIKGYEGRYAVSDRGNVLSMTWGNTNLPKILKAGLSRGYASVFLYDENHQARRFTVHRLVMEAFAGERPKGMQINHKNGIKADNRLENLEYCTNSQNMKHAHATGLQSNRGEKSSQSKFTDADVIAIRRRYKAGEKQTAIAREYGVHPSAVSNLISGRNWSHIPFEGEGRVIQ